MASKTPRHVAIILDGNRRYAKKLGMSPWKGHEFGLAKLEELFKWCIELGIGEVTLYCFSTENFSRNKKEIEYLFSLFWKEFDKIKNGEGIFESQVKVNVIGRLQMFSAKMQDAMAKAVQKTKDNRKLLVNFALAYGGRQEIVDAVNKLIKKGVMNIDEQRLSSNLYLQSEPDIFIRPGGEKRMSNFLLWQSSYSELFFIDKLWPEFTKEDLIAILKEFENRERRFGK